MKIMFIAIEHCLHKTLLLRYSLLDLDKTLVAHLVKFGIRDFSQLLEVLNICIVE